MLSRSFKKVFTGFRVFLMGVVRASQALLGFMLD